MGRNKLLLPLGDRPVILRCLENVSASGVNDIVVVVGATDEELIGTVESSQATVVCNDIPYSDMSQSIRTGLKEIAPSASGVFVCMADQPLVAAKTLKAMLRCHDENPGKIIVPVYRQKRGHPPLLPKGVLAEIATSPTLRDVIGGHPDEVYWLDVDDEGVVMDMDIWEDYQEILLRFGLGDSKGSLHV